MSERLLTISPSPHIHSPLTVPQIMRVVILAMVPALLFATWQFGLGAIYVSSLAVIFCVLSEYVIVKYLFRKSTTIGDGSAIITGLLLAFNVPSNLPWYIILIGSVASVGLAKWTYGGLGNNPFNPALVGRVFLLISFPVQMTSWPEAHPVWTLDGATMATPLGLLKEGLRAGRTVPDIMGELPSLTDFILGLRAGSLGETSGLALLLGMAYMLYKKVITWHTPVSMMLGVVLLSGACWLYDPTHFAHPLFHLLTGGVLLGAIFMATDYVTSPVTQRGMLLYGFCIGILTVLIRLFGSYPEGVSFAILIMNAFVPMINKYVKPPRYGAKPSTQKH
ncbi:MAG: RnfABCDGE type electron transport complex subunit D [Cyclobacteriaceae bacterium]|nr:RnfABCDGE type electron transport complex subunit D [Cyclobacteriaceae bacterium]